MFRKAGCTNYYFESHKTTPKRTKKKHTHTRLQWEGYGLKSTVWPFFHSAAALYRSSHPKMLTGLATDSQNVSACATAPVLQYTVHQIKLLCLFFSRILPTALVFNALLFIAEPK